MLALKPTLVFVTFLTFINVGESKKLVGSFQTHTHDVRGKVYFTDDETTLQIKDFYYDGKYTVSFWIPNYLFLKNPFRTIKNRLL